MAIVHWNKLIPISAADSGTLFTVYFLIISNGSHTARLHSKECDKKSTSILRAWQQQLIFGPIGIAIPVLPTWVSLLCSEEPKSLTTLTLFLVPSVITCFNETIFYPNGYLVHFRIMKCQILSLSYCRVAIHCNILIYFSKDQVCT